MAAPSQERVAAPSAEAWVAPRRRNWPRRLLIGANIIVALCVVVTAAGYGYVRWRFGQIETLDGLAGVLRNGAVDPPPGEPMNVLLVGSDTRQTLDPAEKDDFGSAAQVTGQRSDTIIVLRVDPKHEQASMLSVPRDLYVPIAGTRRSDRVNAAFDAGPDRLIATVSAALGVPIDHYVQVDFNGFRGIVSAVGGVEIYSPARARDSFSGLDIKSAGCVSLNGDQALAFVRSRHYEYFENGRWRSDPTGDLGRIQRQQDFVRRVLKKANGKARGLDVFAINGLVNTGIKNVKIDSGFDPGEISGLARRFKSLDPDAVQMLTVPTVPASIGGAAVLRMKQPEAAAVVAGFLATPEPAPAPGGGPAAPPVPAVELGSIRVRVLNGSGAEGQARQVGKELGELGFNVAGLGEANSFRNTDSVIAYGAGQRDKALVVQSKISGASVLKEDQTLKSIDVVLTTGGNFGGVAGGGALPTAPTTTPAPRATTQAAPPTPGPQC